MKKKIGILSPDCKFDKISINKWTVCVSIIGDFDFDGEEENEEELEI
jgi:hypothetical protein